ncbi:hypothetical protein F4780DRAFT_773316 [Xylariomycetidae sp. FL0641]|nr:hypothetical protein F4780DRAFT_773316 [Xylariomycetidae sp. FL0641]
MSSPVWFITGASSGFGLLLCLRALQADHRVVGAVRNKTKSAEAVAKIESAGGTVMEMDMTESQESIFAKIRGVGQIDYLVNNAGYANLGAFEQFSETDIETQIRTNCFGPMYAMQAALAVMRPRRSGTIVNVSSIAARAPQPSSALYSASKACLEGASEALAAEVAPFNISVLIVEPGSFRTNFLSAGVLQTPARAAPEDYAGTRTAEVMRHFATGGGAQRGDPQKGVERIFEAVTGTGLGGELRGKVLRLVLGEDAWTRLQRNNEKFVQDIQLGEMVARSTDL